jgi:hypothetical protein
MIGLVLGNRQAYQESLRIFQRAQNLYKLVNEATSGRTIPETSFQNTLQKHLIEQLETPAQKVPQGQSFGFYINGGLDRPRFEQTYTETLKAMY